MPHAHLTEREGSLSKVPSQWRKPCALGMGKAAQIPRIHQVHQVHNSTPQHHRPHQVSKVHPAQGLITTILVARLAEQLGIEITSSDEELEGIHNFFGDVPGFADDPAYRSEVGEERVRAWAYVNPRPPLALIHVDGLTPIEIQAVHMGTGYYMMRPRRNQPEAQRLVRHQ